MSKPILKWAGGKGELLPEIVKKFPGKCLGTYWEPFVGGGAVFLGLRSSSKIRRAVLADANSELISLYQIVKKDPEVLGSLLQQLEQAWLKDRKGTYYEVRECHYEKLKARGVRLGTLEGNAARMLFLNRTCFNGLYRVNRKGLFNVPMGNYKNPKIYNSSRLEAFSLALKNTSLKAADFNVCHRARAGDWVYLDPPYFTEGDNFTGYTPGGFGKPEHERLAELFHVLVQKGVHVVASNVDHTFIRKIYKGPGVRVYKTKASRNIAAATENRKKVGEVIVVGRKK